jgi:hypothetical protein
LLLLLISAAWAEPAAETVKFYQSLKKVPADLEASSLVFGAKVRAAVAAANADNVTQMKIALADVLLTLYQIKADSKQLPPAPSVSGKGLAGAVDNYLKQQEKTIVESGPEILKIAGDPALTSGEKASRLQAIVDRNRQGAAAVEGPLTRALMAFAQEHELAGEPTVEFREFMPPDKSCKVSMPDLTENKTSDIGGVKNTYYLAEHKNGVFMLSYADIAPANEDAAALQKRLDDARSGVIKKLDLKVTKEAALVLAGRHPGKELQGNLPDKSLARIRLFIVDGRLYQMWVVGNPTWADSAEATRFLKSLELPR